MFSWTTLSTCRCSGGPMETFAFWWQKIRRKNMSLASCSLARLCKCHAPYLPGKNRQVDWKPFFYAWNWENSHQQHLQLTTLTKFILIPPPSLSSAPQKRRFFEWASHLLKLSRGLTFKHTFQEENELHRLWNATIAIDRLCPNTWQSPWHNWRPDANHSNTKNLATKKWMQHVIHNKWM